MKWGEFDLNWGRPLKSILSIFDKKIISFNFHHLVSSNATFVDKDLEEKKKLLIILKLMKSFLKNMELLIDQNKRLKLIKQNFSKVLSKRGLKIHDNPKLIDEVVNLVDSPNIFCAILIKNFYLCLKKF